METRILVGKIINNSHKNSLIAAAITAILIATFSPPLEAKDRQRFSLYKINKDGITQTLRFTTRKGRKPGCHNLLRKARIHQAVQFRYKVCHVYAKKSCDAESIMSFHLEKEPETTTTDLSQGYAWYPVGDHKRGEKAKSWYCE